MLNQKGQVERLNTILESGLKIQPTTFTSYPKHNELEIITKKIYKILSWFQKQHNFCTFTDEDF